ncbi:MAG: hypothetical protein IJX36_06805 [Thermoguttaceae bacterium]|nr:hypothetical protein [Thermoguttaceae bacterium]MBQ8363617.1 hypothetical protein [Thermoguttaceae bacterium]MBQ9128132.1 hypothetical protein [Thermoguttaceae bacterium]
MEKILETKTAVVAKVPSGATAVLYAAIVEGDPTEAQIETGRNALTATLEIVGATNASSYLLRHKKVELAADESLLLTVDSTYSKISPDPLPDAAEPEPLDETPSTETASIEEVATVGNGENDASSTDAAAPDPLPEVAETSLDENAAAFVEAEASEA